MHLRRSYYTQLGFQPKLIEKADQGATLDRYLHEPIVGIFFLFYLFFFYLFFFYLIFKNKINFLYFFFYFNRSK